MATAYPLLQGIVRIVRERAPERLDGWLAGAAGCGVPDLVTFAAGLRRERAELRPHQDVRAVRDFEDLYRQVAA